MPLNLWDTAFLIDSSLSAVYEMLSVSESAQILKMMSEKVTLPRISPDPDVYLDEEARRQLEGTWPIDLVGDKSKWPRIIHNKIDFMYELVNSSHLDECWVMPNGIHRLGLDKSIPYEITCRLGQFDNAYDFVRSFTPEMKETYKARFCYTEKTCGIGDKNERVQKEASGSSLSDKIQFLEAGITRKEHPIEKHTIYLTELRYEKAYPHPISGELVKTVSSIDIKDIAESMRPKPADRMYMYWDRYDEGLFTGGKNSGKCMHVDQCLWSNIGKNYAGWKLLALWSVADSNDILDQLSRETFEAPLTNSQIAALRRACRIVLVRPGDVCLFSGGIAHTVISISKELSMTVYESFVSMNPRNIEHWLDSANPAVQHPAFTMPDSDLDSIEDDVLDHLDRVDFVLDREDKEAYEAVLASTTSRTSHKDVEDTVRNINSYEDFEGHHYQHYGPAMDTAHKHIAAAVECVTRKRKYFRKELRKTKRLCAYIHSP